MAKYGDFTATGAFYWDTVVDLSAYAGNDVGSTPYSILLTDAVGKTARGFIGAVGAGGAGPNGESLDAELLPNPGFEGTYVSGVAPNWTVDRGTKSEYTASPHGGVSAQQSGNPAGTSSYVNKNVASITGQLYHFSAWFKALAGSGRWGGSIAAGGYTFETGLPDSAWAQKYGRYLCETASGDNVFINLHATSNAVAGTNSVVWDDASIKRVLDPPSTGVHIVSAYGGSTRAWTSIDSGFNPNTVTSAVAYLSALTIQNTAHTHTVSTVTISFAATAGVTGGGCGMTIGITI